MFAYRDFAAGVVMAYLEALVASGDVTREGEVWRPVWREEVSKEQQRSLFGE